MKQKRRARYPARHAPLLIADRNKLMHVADNVYTLSTPPKEENSREAFLPPDVDLTGFHYIPLSPDEIERSLDWRRARREPFYAYRFFALLIASFRDKPAGSLPNDDQALADALGMDDAAWAGIKAETMRGWSLCSDGRWHHPVVAAIIGEAWEKHGRNRARTAAATAAKEARRNEERGVPRHDDRNDLPGKEKKESKENNEKKDSKSCSPRGDQVAFEQFWEAFPNKVGRRAAIKAFGPALTRAGGDLARVIAGLEAYKVAKPTERQWLNPATFLNQDRFDDQPAPAALPEDADPIGMFRDRGAWGVNDRKMRKSAFERQYGKFPRNGYSWEPLLPDAKA